MRAATLELWLVRHGETTASAARRIAGWSDPALTSKGEAQARRVGEMLAGERYDRVWSSDLRRAMESARLAAEGGSSWPPAVADARLRELNFGRFEGRGYDEVGGRFGEVVARFRDFEVPGGESWQGFRDRIMAFVDELEKGRHLLFVHGGVIRVLTQDLGLDRFVTTGSVVVIAPRDGRLLDIREAEE